MSLLQSSLHCLAPTALAVLFATTSYAATSPATVPPPTCGTNDVAVQVLGSGGPEMKGRASSSYLIWQQGKARVLIDAGGGSGQPDPVASAQKAIERAFKGPISFANDLDCFPVH